MNLKANVKDLYAMLFQGRTEEAWEKYYAEDVVRRTEWETRVGRTQNRDEDREFVDNVESWKSNEITAMGADEEREVTMVQFSQEFMHKKFGPLRQEIVIVQRWRDGRVYDESVYVMKLNNKSGGLPSRTNWRLVSQVIDGKNHPVDGTTVVTSMGNNFSVTQDGVEVMKGTARVVSDGTPMQQDIALDRGPNAGKTFRQIIKVESDKMIACDGPPDGERPTEFTSEPGSGRTLAVWLQVKPEDAS